jgi:hypothetical protein
MLGSHSITTHDPFPHDHALQARENGNESARLKVSYFHPDIHSKIVERARKENLIQEEALSEVRGRADLT